MSLIFKLHWIILINCSPIFQNSLRPDLYADEKDLKDMTQCRKLMLEYDIDLSQEAFLGDDTWISSYNRALAYFNHVSTSQLNRG